MSITIENSEKETWFKISDHDDLRPFFMSLVSDSNHWMFISSNGGLTAGRKNAEYALFPYYTDDKLTELADTTGGKTIFQVFTDEGVQVWEPFSERDAYRYKCTRNLYKNRYGNKILFEEINHDLELTFKYEWNSSNEFGFVRRSQLINHSSDEQKVSVLDGIQNILPHGVNSDLQTRSSNLVDAYKRSELVKDTGLGIFALSAIIVDKAEPSEALKANVVWSLGLEEPRFLLSSLQLDKFRDMVPVVEETDVKGEKGAYFIQTEINLEGGKDKSWMIVANVNQNHPNVIRLNEAIRSGEDLKSRVDQDVERGTEKLIQLVAGADGLEATSDEYQDARHYSNVLFNIMRGGTFDKNYVVEKADFEKYLRNANSTVFDQNSVFFSKLNETFTKFELDSLLSESEDADLDRLAGEYLSLKFSRRHGDPSRPWNKFSINTHSEVDGSKILDYEGNWRDIFQNWEALVHSYPLFVESMISKFLNATTFDGYNPYRVTKGGFDWETIEPDDPWSYIGYWGDHQIIYLLKFLEFYNDYRPEAFKALFRKNNFVYANVPYRIKSYEDILNDPKDTIDFDMESDRDIREKVAEIGADGALLKSSKDDIHHVNFLEKILATVLSKISNFIPEGGIWMNTQRPEWNDANNALVGNGVSMVTLYYLRRFLKFVESRLEEAEVDEIAVSDELNTFFSNIKAVLEQKKQLLDTSIDDEKRKDITDGLGKAGSDFRNTIYDQGFSGKKSGLSLSEVQHFVEVALEYLEHSIRANKREDNLYHAYNLMSVEGEGISISYLDEMLEGQVAVLSSKYLSPEDSLKVLDALRNSALYRKDQQSYILYPNKDLPGFLERNNIPEELVKKSELLQTLIADGNLDIINKDVNGGFHFNGNFKNARDLKNKIDEMRSGKYGSMIKKEEQLLLDIFEQVFDHKSFTGRSGTFFAYEGLGSIYWHMVSKLHLAVTEITIEAHEGQVDPSTLDQLLKHFDEVGKGIGIHKDPEVYGAFPTDPYSHTPQHRGAQQPGMTGQVKEDILVRFAQLGLRVEDGILSFDPFLLSSDAFIAESKAFELVDLGQEKYSISLPENSLLFTCCQVPVIYKLNDTNSIKVEFSDGEIEELDSLGLTKQLSDELFKRSGNVKQITVSLKESELR
ncbi:MAG: hypothetical protein CL666_08355 [Balneola sp.]|nr:hypothetical protein [Balneola sp.]